MPFTLKLGFGGLCLFVREPETANAGPKMHVLMADTAAHGHVHETWLISDQLVGVNHPADHSPKVQFVRETLDLSAALTSSDVLGPPPPDVANLEGLCTVPRAMLQDVYTGQELVARAAFTAGKSVRAACGAGAFHRFRGLSGRQLPIRVVWTIEASGSQLVIPIKPFGSSSPSRTVTLQPRHGVITLWVFHVPSGGVGAKLPPRTSRTRPPPGPNPHFQALLMMLGVSPSLSPVFEGPEHPDGGPFPACYAPADTTKRRVGYDLMCIAAQAPMEP